MTQIGPGILCVNESFAIGVDGREIVFPLLVTHVHDAFRSKNHTVATVARRHNAVKHIDATGDAFENIGRCANPHQITRLILRQNGVDQFCHLIHFFSRFTHGQSTNGVACCILRCNVLCRLLTKVTIDTTLYDGEQGLFIAIFRFGSLKAFTTTVEPAVGSLHRLLGILIVSGARRTLVESHHDVGTNATLYVHHLFRSEQVPRPIDMRLKSDTFLFHLADTRQGEHLKATAVSQYRSVPAIELVQTANFFKDVQTGTQI